MNIFQCVHALTGCCVASQPQPCSELHLAARIWQNTVNIVNTTSVIRFCKFVVGLERSHQSCLRQAVRFVAWLMQKSLFRRILHAAQSRIDSILYQQAVPKLQGAAGYVTSLWVV